MTTSRREVLRLLGVAAASALGGAMAPGCAAPGAGTSGAVTVPLDGLSEGARMVVTWHDGPVEVQRTGAGVIARSLTCSHQGCTVKWDAARERYACPCQNNAYFDRDGRVISGPPPKNLASVPARIEGNRVIVGTDSE